MAINYKRELEAAAKSMIMVHDPDTLIRMIVRMIVQKVRVSHAGILLYHKDSDSYVLTVSRGTLGIRIPRGFARMDQDNPLISFFRERRDKQIFGDGMLVYSDAKRKLARRSDVDTKLILNDVLYQMQICSAAVCIPSYYRDELLGILILGAKKKNERFASDELNFFSALASDVAMAIRNAQLFKELRAELDKNKRLFMHTMIALTTFIDAKDHYTHGHTARVTNLSMLIAGKLSQKDSDTLNPKFLEHLHIAGLLHDIGKVVTPETILNKNGPLTETELKRMQEHASVGANILQPIKELEDSILGVKYHHEHYDGSGYPDGLKGDQIPLIASIISVADAFDAMITDRSYRSALSKEAAVEELRRLSGKQFAPQVTEAFSELYREGKI